MRNSWQLFLNLKIKCILYESFITFLNLPFLQSIYMNKIEVLKAIIKFKKIIRKIGRTFRDIVFQIYRKKFSKCHSYFLYYKI